MGRFIGIGIGSASLLFILVYLYIALETFRWEMRTRREIRQLQQQFHEMTYDDPAYKRLPNSTPKWDTLWP